MTSDMAAGFATAVADRYTIERELGSGGMATVYLAHDLRHDRSVAIKVLLPELAAVLGANRFLQEIKTTANLQHPHILPLFDSGEADSFLYYVMPFVDGETLRERLNREKQLPIDATIRLTTQVAEALQYAHDRNVIHRDIKPENVLLDDDNGMVADFGIALAVQQAGGSRLTQTGLSLGTPGYMSPEQATADRAPDARSDIYSLGCVAYEMLTGDPPHTGSSAQTVIAKIVTDEPKPINDLRKATPPFLAGAIHKALAKLPADRWPSAAEFKTALTSPTAALTSSFPGAKRSTRFMSGVATGVAVIGLALGYWFGARSGNELASGRAFYASLTLPTFDADLSSSSEVSTFAISPDGKDIVYAALPATGEAILYRRASDQLEATPIIGSEGAVDPSFSPDGQHLLFSRAGGAYHRLPITGGTASRVTDSIVLGELDWAADNMLYGTNRSTRSLVRIDPATGVLTKLSELGAGESFHSSPNLVTGGNGLVFVRRRPDGADSVAVLDLRTNEIKTLFPGLEVRYAQPGYLFIQGTDNLLQFARFDPSTLEALGPLQLLATDVDRWTHSDNGVLIYKSVSSALSRLVWVSRNGERERAIPVVRDFEYVAISPSGNRAAVVIQAAPGNTDVWTYDLTGVAPPIPLTFGGSNDHPAWIGTSGVLGFEGGPGAFQRRSSGEDLYQVRADGSEEPRRVLRRDGRVLLGNWTPDGSSAVFYVQTPNGRDIHIFTMGDSTSVPMLATPANERAPILSRDGQWLAYVTNESGEDQVYVTSYPDGSGKWLISSGVGHEPVWAWNNRELFYRGADAYWVVEFVTEPGFRVLRQTRLFDSGLFEVSPHTRRYDVDVGDDRFLMILPTGSGVDFFIITDWLSYVTGERGG